MSTCQALRDTNVCRAVKQRDAELPVVLLVGAFESFDPSDAANCGADATMKKPFDSKELFSTVEGLVAARPAAPEPVAPQPADGADSALNLIPDASSTPEVAIFDPAPVGARPEIANPTADPSPLANLAPISAPTESEPAPPVEAPSVAAPSTEPMAAEAPTPERAPLSDEDVDRIARRVAELLGEQGVREVAWEVIPDLAEIVIKDRIRELESQVE